MKLKKFHAIFIIIVSLMILPILLSDSAKAALVPEWIKNTAKWYGDDQITEVEFLNAIKYLIDNGIIEISGMTMDLQTE